MSSRIVPLLTTLVLCVAVFSSMLRHRGPVTLPATLSARPNVILVTIDTLRADHLGCYDYPRDTSPFIDGLARRGVLFERAMSSASATAPSLASVFTGLEVDQHGVYNNFFDHFPDHYSSLYTMAHMFADQGYKPIGITAVSFLGYLNDDFSEFWMGDRPKGRRPGRPAGDPAARYHYSPADSQYAEFTKVLSRLAPGERFFIWLHFYDVHENDKHHRAHDTQVDYRKLFDISSEKHRQDFVDAVYGTCSKVLQAQNQLDAVNVYDEKIYFVDRYLERIYEEVEAKGLNDDTLWVIGADHGEGLWHHRIDGHDGEIYNAELHVPLIFHSARMPEGGTRVGQLVRNVDILPTLAEIVGGSLAKERMDVQGRSLVPLLNGEDTVVTDYAYSRLPMYHRNWVKTGVAKGVGYALQSLDYKYMFHTHLDDEFYDLAKDPHETNNIIETGPPAADRLLSALQALHRRFNADYRKHLQAGGHVEIGDDVREELKALGYAD